MQRGRAALGELRPPPMKARNQISATELAELHQFIGRRLDALGIDSQPEVALKLLELTKDSKAQLRDYASIIKADQAISGRVLKLANSAMFAQRTSVTTLDRACTLLGIERLKAVAMGFHLSRAASTNDASIRDLSRDVWGQSVFRACMASQAARIIAPNLVAEAFIIGLMLDAGIPLAAKIAGPHYVHAHKTLTNPPKFHRHEMEAMEFSHIDIMSVLGVKWRLPELLTRPIELHHTRPAENARDDGPGRLHRIAFIVGQLELDVAELKKSGSLLNADGGTFGAIRRLLAISEQQMSQLVASSVKEYKVMLDIFAEVASAIVNIDDLTAMAHNCLVGHLDNELAQTLAREHGPNASKVALTIQGSNIEVVRDSDGSIVAFVVDSEGNRVVSHRLSRDTESPLAICEHLGLEAPAEADALALSKGVRSLAA